MRRSDTPYPKHAWWVFILLWVLSSFMVSAALVLITGRKDLYVGIGASILLYVLFRYGCRNCYTRWIACWQPDDRYEIDAVISEFTRKVSADLDVDGLARLFVGLLPEQLEVSWVGLWLHHEVGEAWVRDPSGEIIMLETPRFHLAASRGIGLGELPSRLEPSDAWLHVRSLPLAQPIKVGSVPWHVIVPLRGIANVEGVLLLGPKQSGRAYCEKDLRMVETLGIWLGTYVGGVRLLQERVIHEREQNLELARQEHRSRRHMAAELHDQVLPVFMYMRSLITTGKYDQLDAALMEAVSVVRGVMQSLTPDGLEGGLHRALEEMRLRYEAIGDPVEVEIQDVDEVAEKLLQGSLGYDLCLIIYEAVCNAKKSADSVPVGVQVQGTLEGLEVVIRDQGPGFDILEPGKRRYGRGLWNMQARAERMGGRLDIRSKIGSGTVVALRVPMQVIRQEFGGELMTAAPEQWENERIS